MSKAFTILITGLPGSGKTTMAALLQKKLNLPEMELLDGDQLRKNICSDLGFSADDRIKNAERINYLARILNKHGVAVIIPVIAPYEKMRQIIKNGIDNFLEVYLECPLETCKSRDPKGLYKKAEAREIKEFTGVSAPFEIPLDPDVICNTENKDAEYCTGQIIQKLEELKLLQND